MRRVDGLSGVEIPPNRFHQEATTEVQRRAAEWERQIEHLDAKELFNVKLSRGFFDESCCG